MVWRMATRSHMSLNLLRNLRDELMARDVWDGILEIESRINLTERQELQKMARGNKGRKHFV